MSYQGQTAPTGGSRPPLCDTSGFPGDTLTSLLTKAAQVQDTIGKACQSVDPTNPAPPQAADQLQKHAVLSAKLMGLLKELEQAQKPLTEIAALPTLPPTSQHEHAVIGTLLRTKLDPRLEEIDAEDEARVRANVKEASATEYDSESEEEDAGEEGVEEALAAIQARVNTHDGVVEQAINRIAFLRGGMDLRERILVESDTLDDEDEDAMALALDEPDTGLMALRRTVRAISRGTS